MRAWCHLNCYCHLPFGFFDKTTLAGRRPGTGDRLLWSVSVADSLEWSGRSGHLPVPAGGIDCRVDWLASQYRHVCRLHLFPPVRAQWFTSDRGGSAIYGGHPYLENDLAGLADIAPSALNQWFEAGYKQNCEALEESQDYQF